MPSARFTNGTRYLRGTLHSREKLPFDSLVTTSLIQLDLGTSAYGERLVRAAAVAVGALRSVVREGAIAIYLEPLLDELAVAQIDPMIAPAPADDYRLELRFASWLTTSETPRVRAVPQYLSTWLPLQKALVVPALDGKRRRGALVADASKLAREPLQQLEQLARELAEKLAEHEGRTPPVDPARDRFVLSVRRIKLSH